MQVPIGRSGVQAVPNTRHSHGLIAPISTSPHWQAFGSSTRVAGQLEAGLGVPVGELGPQLQRAPLDPAEAAPLEGVAQLHRLLDRRERARVAVAAHDARVLVLDLAAALARAGAASITTACRMSSGSKRGRRRPACRTRAAMKSYGRVPITVETWPGRDEPVEPQARASRGSPAAAARS